MTTNVPPLIFTSRGFVAPAESDILAGVQADQNVAFGGGLNPALSTPQGQLAQSESSIIGSIYDTFVYMANMFDPNYAEGRWQDGLAAIYFITRKPAVPTVVTATCTGLPGTVIAVGALAQAVDGNVYVCTSGGTIASGGSVDVEFSCSVPGPISCPAGALNQIYQAIYGWDAVTNNTDGVVGQDTETRDAFEARRFQSVAQNSIGALPSVLGSVLSVEDILDAYVTENPTGAPVATGGVTIPAHCLYVAALGGTDDDVANAIWTKKAPGCDTFGSTSITVYDKNYNTPYPAYTINFQRPTPLTILFAVALASNAGVPSDARDQVQAAVLSAFSGGDGGIRARIGDDIFASRYYAPVAALGSWVQIRSISLGCQNNSSSQFTASISGTTLTVSATASGAVAINQYVVDASGLVAPGTRITAGSGTTWTVSVSQTVASETMFGCVINRDDVTAQINQAPTLSEDNIVVTIT